VHFGVSEGKGCKQKLLLGISPNYSHQSILETGTNCRVERSHYCYCVDMPQIIRKMTRRLSRVSPETVDKLRLIAQDVKNKPKGPTPATPTDKPNNGPPTTAAADKPKGPTTAADKPKTPTDKPDTVVNTTPETPPDTPEQKVEEPVVSPPPSPTNKRKQKTPTTTT